MQACSLTLLPTSRDQGIFATGILIVSASRRARTGSTCVSLSPAVVTNCSAGSSRHAFQGGFVTRSGMIIGILACALALCARTAAAQTPSGIAGAVRDSSGAVLPGVTVEAASPALIEKTRTVTTDGQGQYKIVDLRPGTYQVTFSLTGFNVVRRDGIELTAGFTATVNGEMQVGSLNET